MQLQGTGATSNAVHPGLIKTELGRHVEEMVQNATASVLFSPIAYLFDLAKMDANSGSLTQLYVATADVVKGVTGKLFYPIAVEAVPSLHAQNLTMQKMLWQISENLIVSV